LLPSTGITPRDYNIPYEVSYYNENDKDTVLVDKGSFGVRVGAKTELDYSVYPEGDAIIGENGEVTLEIINRGLGEIKSISVELYPEGFELMSKPKVFVGSIDSDDTDVVTYNVRYTSQNSIFRAKISYKDFDNVDQKEIIALPFEVYTREEAKNLDLLKTNHTITYVIIIIALLIIWFFWRKSRRNKRRKKSK